MVENPGFERVAFSPGEFAKLFGKSQTWGYRQIYAGKVKAITEFGRTQIPASEVERVLSTAGIYDGLKSKPMKTKAEFERITAKAPNAWNRFLDARRSREAAISEGGKTSLEIGSGKSESRRAALQRLTKMPRR